jgi:hypothetical protein
MQGIGLGFGRGEAHASSMHLIQILLPHYDNTGQRFSATIYRSLEATLAERFGGVTFYSRSAAEGTWRDRHGSQHRDDIVVVEVMVETLDRDWWRAFRQGLKASFRQQELVVRASAIELL